MKKKTTYTLLITLCIIGFWLFENYYTADTYSNPKSSDAHVVNMDFLPNSTTGEVIKHEFYTLSYSEPHEQAEWVAYELKKSHLTHDDRKRPYFIEDPKVSSKSADWRNYRGSGYDRGHLCPAGDRRFSEQAYNETFYTSNISPQDREFNAGVWNRLEQQVRNWCRTYGDLMVITGGVLEEGLEEIGEEDVDVPRAFYKIVLRKEGEQVKALAFLMDARESQASLNTFLVPIATLEARTGLDFFQKRPKSWQDKVEKAVDTSGWDF
jgi:endonuclease G